MNRNQVSLTHKDDVKPIMSYHENPTIDQSTNVKTIITKSSWTGVYEIVCNILGTFGFVIGSSFWIFGSQDIGSITFGVASILSALGQAFYGQKFYLSNDYIGVYAMIQIGCGGILFAVASFLWVVPDLLMVICLIGFFWGSLFFLTGCLLTQFQCRLWLGVLAPLFPNTVKFIPTGLFNTIGSVFFTVGSILLFVDATAVAGGWCYEIGSFLFFIAAWGEGANWWRPAEQLTRICDECPGTAVAQKT